MHGRIWAAVLCLLPGVAWAADACPWLRAQMSSGDVATRIAAYACNENFLWYRPFIDASGRVADTSVSEAEATRLSDGSEAWRRVAAYWRDSGLLWQMNGYFGAADCGRATGDRMSSASCRAFLIDNPWSAAFVSWVMAKAGVPGFQRSASHYDYVRDARRGDGSPYLFLNPGSARPAAGDLLCYVRMSRLYGYDGLLAAIDDGIASLAMHCDIVVAANPGNDGKVYAVGGNVQQGVTMRILGLSQSGQLWSLPRRAEIDPPCSPDVPAACNFSRQDWSVLLKLKPPAELARLAPARPVPQPLTTPSPQQACCTYCVVGAVPALPRCPVRPPLPPPTSPQQHPQQPQTPPGG